MALRTRRPRRRPRLRLPTPSSAHAFGLKKAVAEAKAERFGSAGEAFDASYAAIPRANTLFNAAWAYDHASDWVRATERYRTYLARYPAAADSEEVERSLLRVETEVAELRVVIVGGREPLTLKIDDSSVPIDGPPKVLLPGKVRVEVRDAKGQARTETLTLRAGQRSSVELTLSSGDSSSVTQPGPGSEGGSQDGAETGNPRGTQVGPKDPTRTPTARRRWARPAMWSSISLAGAGAIGVAALGPLTTRESKRFGAALCESPCPSGSTYPSEIEARWRRYRAGTNAMISVAAVGATGALIFGLIARKQAKAVGERGDDAPPPGEGEPKGSGDRARVRVEPSTQGLRLRF